MKGISKSEVSRICRELDEVVIAFKERPLEGQFPYVWLDATFPKVREGGRVRSMALVVAIGIRETGDREVLGFDLGMSEDGSFWLEFLRKLVARGLRGVQLAISDAHEGLRRAIEQVLAGATWQRCRVHFMRNVLSQVPKSSQSMVSSIIRTIFAQPSQEAAVMQLRQVAQQFPNAMKKDRSSSPPTNRTAHGEKSLVTQCWQRPYWTDSCIIPSRSTSRGRATASRKRRKRAFSGPNQPATTLNRPTRPVAI